MILDRIEQAGTKDYVESLIKIKKSERDRKMFGKIIFKQPLNDSVFIKLGVSKKTSSGYNVMPFKVEKPICAFVAEDTYFYKYLVKFSTYPDTMPCPTPVVSILGIQLAELFVKRLSTFR